VRRPGKIAALVSASALFAVAVAAGVLWFLGAWRPNNPSRERYPVRGVDVSAYQGAIDWPMLAAQGIEFAYVKATEGSAHVDQMFAANWAAVWQTGLRAGAYHFFSFETPGRTQAENFIAAVPPVEHMLPPAIDVEFYGGARKNPPARDGVVRELSALIEALEVRYGVRPVLYATGKAYDTYLAGEFGAYDIWIRNVFFAPGTLPDGRDWTFWQYADHARLDGYAGEEKFIDLNAFRGTPDEFLAYGQ
jgi:lysozyme